MAEGIGKMGQTSDSFEVKVQGLATGKLKIDRFTASAGDKEEEETKIELRFTVYKG